MPYGFIKHIEEKGYSAETVTSYEKVINQFFGFIKSEYNNNKEPFQISPTDIKNYLEEQRERSKGISTVNKELAILKTFFNYLWEIDKVPIDPAVKIKRYKVEALPKLDVTFTEIMEIFENVLKNEAYTAGRKAIFLLATKGLRSSEFRFKKDDVFDSIKDNKVTIRLKNREITLEGKEGTCFLEYYYEAALNGSDFVFTTKQHGEDTASPIQVMSILNHLRAISLDYLPKEAQKLTLISIRKAIAYDLYIKKNSIQSIAKFLGIEENSASTYLKHLTRGTALSKST